ncbi:topoisomerase 3-alpha isoform X2 [Leptinotarsa decemlineata]|uniref:topoisomerase 3-alpha isoform X2 n=1 Tax=Leptinotarsa decemlineata TaxID=7539 RepID=UPI003D305062
MVLCNFRNIFNYFLNARHYSTDTKIIMRYLNVAEKNDAAKNIASILSRGNSNRREGFSVYNKIYEFTAHVLGEEATMIMTSVSGHLLNYEFTVNHKSWQGCNPVELFDAPVVKTCHADFQNIKRTLEREIRSCQGLIIWTDCDREGENIGFEIIKVCSDVKPNLRIYRAKFSEITAASVFRALNTLGQPNRNISDAVDVRQELDLRTGAAFTRLQTLRLQKVFPQKLADKLISYGSCQFPTLGFVVERYQAIEDFIAEPFWRIKMNHTVKDVTTDFTWKRDRLFDKNCCQAILDICKENPQAVVESVESKEKSKWRPLPLDTVEMEKNASRKLKINAKDAMKIAEKLYTQGFISYPRTETNIFPKELNLTNLVEQQRDDPRWGPFAQRIINEGGPTPRQGRKSDQAHPPIHPIKLATNLTGNEQRLYEYIVRHFLACVHKDAKGFETTVIVDIANEKFTAKGLVVLEKNYLDVYIYEKWNAKEMNNYSIGDTFIPTVLDIVESSTSPPKLLTEADLIALMEKHGIGTDATHAEHIDKIKSREYVGLHENMYFVPGILGMGLVEGYNNIGLEVSLAKPVLRAEFENDLKLICDGLKNPEEVRQEQIAKYRAVFQTVLQKLQLIDESLANRLDDRPVAIANDTVSNEEYRPAMKCPKCGNDMVLRNKKNGPGQFLSCNGYPECRNSIWFPTTVEKIEVLNEHCQYCGPTYKKLKLKFKQNLFPGEPNPNVLCIGGCDINVLETLDINLSSVAQRTVSNNGDPNLRNQTILNNTNVPQQNNFNNFVPRSNRDSGYNDSTSITESNVSRSNNQTRNSSWISTDLTRTSQSNSTRTLNLLPGPSRTSSGSTVQEGHIVCGCNNDAKMLTVRKDGANKGRNFYKCASDTCGFFLWAPDTDGVSSASNQIQNQINQNSEPRCNCHQPAVLRTVSKAGPNTGRKFYVCSKPRGQGCTFFKWADEDQDGNNGGDDWGGGGGGGGGGNFGNRNNNSWRGKQQGGSTNNNARNNPAPHKNQTRAKRKCGICGQEGHTRNRCPNN